MNEVIQNIITRRSIRSYKDDQISEKDLDLILMAAQYAPSGGNSQSCHFIVLQNKKKLEYLNTLVRQCFKNMIIDDTTYKARKNTKAAAQNDNYNFYYNAPTLVIVSNEKVYPNAMADSAAALQNIFLAAHSLGIGSCWINQLVWLGDDPAVKKALMELGLPADHMVCGASALGYNLGNEPNASLRREGRVTIEKFVD